MADKSKRTNEGCKDASDHFGGPQIMSWYLSVEDNVGTFGYISLPERQMHVSEVLFEIEWGRYERRRKEKCHGNVDIMLLTASLTVNASI